MLTKSEDKGYTAVAIECHTGQRVVAADKFAEAANSPTYRRRSLGRRLRADKPAVGGWRVRLGIAF